MESVKMARYVADMMKHNARVTHSETLAILRVDNIRRGQIL